MVLSLIITKKLAGKRQFSRRSWTNVATLFLYDVLLCQINQAFKMKHSYLVWHECQNKELFVMSNHIKSHIDSFASHAHAAELRIVTHRHRCADHKKKRERKQQWYTKGTAITASVAFVSTGSFYSYPSHYERGTLFPSSVIPDRLRTSSRFFIIGSDRSLRSTRDNRQSLVSSTQSHCSSHSQASRLLPQRPGALVSRNTRFHGAIAGFTIAVSEEAKRRKQRRRRNGNR